VIQPYSPPLVEQWVSDALIHAGILCPADIYADNLCAAFGIEYGNHFGVSGSAIITGVPYIAVDCRLSVPKRHEQFLHELGHVLRHYGDQYDMPQTLREYQEWDADLFAMYAAIPFHMIDFDKGYSLVTLMDDFCVTKSLAAKRMDDIRQKAFFAEKDRPISPAYRPFSLSRCSDETKRIMHKLSRQTGVKQL
jgi:Domain of unknown function (DUF955).